MAKNAAAKFLQQHFFTRQVQTIVRIISKRGVTQEQAGKRSGNPKGFLPSSPLQLKNEGRKTLTVRPDCD
jgi:hypothetical protein